MEKYKVILELSYIEDCASQWIARVEKVPSIIGVGSTVEEATIALREAVDMWVEYKRDEAKK